MKQDNEHAKIGSANVDADAGINALRSYSEMKLSLAEILRPMRQELLALGRTNAEKECAELIVKLAEDRFTLAVLGQFKRGKSSLMNAIIGGEILPTGVLPLTSAITILKYGPTQRLIVNRENAIFSDEVPVSALAEYVTEKGNPNNQKKIKSVYLEMPTPFLRYGIEFVDTPGVGSAIIANTETTYNFLPECDAVLFVTGVDTPMTSVELELLTRIKNYVSKLFFVINKIDLVTDSQKSEIIEFVSQIIAQSTAHNTAKIFPVSSQLAIEAKKSEDTNMLAKSGLKALEDELSSFLTVGKSAVFLATIAEKALRILNLEIAENIFSEDFLQTRIKEIKNEKVATYRHEPHIAAKILTDVKTKLEAFIKNDAILSNLQEEATALAIPDLSKSKSNESALSFDYANAIDQSENADVILDLQGRNCPVCQHLIEQAFDFFAKWQYQIVADEQAQNEFATELGFCPLHSWQLLSISSPYGASVGYARLAAQIAHQLKPGNHVSENGEAVKQLVHNSKNCKVCELLRQAEKIYIQKLSAMLNDNNSRKIFEQSQGACLWHLGMLLDSVKPTEIKNFLLSNAIRLFEQDAEDMRNFALKNDALRKSLQNQNEKDAYRRTIVHIVGERRVCMPWTEEG